MGFTAHPPRHTLPHHPTLTGPTSTRPSCMQSPCPSSTRTRVKKSTAAGRPNAKEPNRHPSDHNVTSNTSDCVDGSRVISNHSFKSDGRPPAFMKASISQADGVGSSKSNSTSVQLGKAAQSPAVPPVRGSLAKQSSAACSSSVHEHLARSTSAIVEVVPTSAEAVSATTGNCSGSDPASSPHTELFTVLRGSDSGSTDSPRCSMAETLAPGPRGTASGSTSTEHSSPSSLTSSHGRHGGGTAAASTTGMDSTTTIPHPPVILTARALARASRTSNVHAARMRGPAADGVTFAVTETSKAASLHPPPPADITSTPVGAAASLIPPHLRRDSLDSAALVTVAPTAAVVAPFTGDAANASATRPPVHLLASLTSGSSPSLTSAAIIATTATNSGRGALPSRRRLRRGSTRGDGGSGHSFSSFSVPSVPSLGTSGLASSDTRTLNHNSSSNDRIAGSGGGGSPSPRRPPIVQNNRDGGSSSNSRERRSGAGAPVTKVASPASTDSFRPMLPATLAARRRSQSSLSTVCSSSANGSSTSPTKDRTLPLPRVLIGSTSSSDTPASGTTTTLAESVNASSPVPVARLRKRVTAPTTVKGSRARGAASGGAASLLPRMISVKEGGTKAGDGGGGGGGAAAAARLKSLPQLGCAALSTPSLATTLSASSSAVAAQRRPTCYPLVSRTLPSAIVATPAAPLSPQPVSTTVRVVGPAGTSSYSSSVTTGVEVQVNSISGGGGAATLTALDIVGVGKLDNGASPLSPPARRHSTDRRTSRGTIEKSGSVTAVSPLAGGDAAGSAAGVAGNASTGTKPPLSLSTPSAVSPPLLHAPTLLSVAVNGSSPVHIVASFSALPQCFLKASPPCPTTTCSAGCHVSAQSSSTSPALSSNHASLSGNGGSSYGGKGHIRRSSDNNFVAAARRVSASQPTSPAPPPQVLPPPQRLSPSIVAVAAGAKVGKAETVAPSVCLPPSRSVAATAAVAATPETRSNNTTPSTHRLHGRAGASSTDSLNSRSAVDATSSGMARPPSPSSTQLLPPPSSVHALHTPSDGLFTGSSRTAELSPNLRAGLDGPGPLPLGTDFTFMLQSSSTFSTPLTLSESSSVMEDSSMYFGTSMHTHRFVSNSRILPSRTPLNPVMTSASGRGGSIDSTFCAPTHIVAAVPSATGRTTGAPTTPSTNPIGGAVDTPQLRPINSTGSPMTDNITTAAPKWKSGEEGVAAAAAAAGAGTQARRGSCNSCLHDAASKGNDGHAPAVQGDACGAVCIRNSAGEMSSELRSGVVGTVGESGSRVGDCDEPSHQREPGQPPEPLPSLAALRTTSSGSSSSKHDDAVLKSSSTDNVLHTNPSIASFASDESHSSHSQEREAARARRPPHDDDLRSLSRPPRPHASHDTAHATGNGSNESTGDSRRSSRGQRSHQHTPSTTLKTSSGSTCDEWIANADDSEKPVKDTLPPPLRRTQELDEAAQQATQQESQRRRSSTIKMRSETASHLAERLHKLMQWSGRRGSKSSQSGSTTTQLTQQDSVESNSLFCDGASLTIFGMSNNTVSTTQAFADFPPPAPLPSGAGRRNRVNSSRRPSETGSGAAESRVDSLTRTVSVMSSTLHDIDSAPHASASSTAAASKRLKHTLTQAVARLWTKSSNHGSRRSSVAATTGASFTESITGAVPPPLCAAAAAETAAQIAPLTSSKTAASFLSDTSTVKECSVPLPHFLPTSISAPTSVAGDGGERSCHLSRRSMSGIDHSGSSATPKPLDATATPRVLHATSSGRCEEGGEGDGDVDAAAPQRTHQGEAGALLPQPVMSSYEEVIASPTGTDRFVGDAKSLPLPPTLLSTSAPSSRGRSSSKERSPCSSGDATALEEVETQRSRQRNSITTSGSANPSVCHDSTQAPAPWHSVDRLASGEDAPVLRLDHASPLCPHPSVSHSASQSSSSASSLSPSVSDAASGSELSAAGRTARSARSEVSVTTVTKPFPAGKDHCAELIGPPSSGSTGKSSNTYTVAAVPSSSSSSLQKPAVQGSGWQHLEGQAPLSLQLPSPAQIHIGGHGLYAAFQAHQRDAAAVRTPLYAGLGQATYERFIGAAAGSNGNSSSNSSHSRVPLRPPTMQQMPNMSNPFAVAAAARSRPGLSRLESSRPGSRGLRRSRSGDTHASSTATAAAGVTAPLHPAFHTTMAVSGEMHNADTGNLSEPNSPLSELPMPPNTVALPEAKREVRASALPASSGDATGSKIVAAWMNAAQTLFPTSDQLTSLRVPLSTSPTANMPAAAVHPSGGGSSSSSCSSGTSTPFARAIPQFETDAPPRKRVFTSALGASVAMDPSMPNAKGDAARTTAVATTTVSEAHYSHSPDSTVSGSSWRWSVGQAATVLGFTPINVGTAAGPTPMRSRRSLNSTSNRKWSSSMTSSHGSGLGGTSHSHHGNQGNNLLRATSGSVSLLPHATGSSPTSPQNSRRGFSGRKFLTSSGCSTTGGGTGNVSESGTANSSGRSSPRKHKSSVPRQQSLSSAHGLSGPPCVTSSEGRRSGQVVLVDATPTPASAEQQQQRSLSSQLVRVVIPTRTRRVSLVPSSGDGGNGAAPFHFAPQRDACGCQQPLRKLSEASTQCATLGSMTEGDRSRARSIASSHGGGAAEENWLTELTPPVEGNSGASVTNWMSLGVSPGFTPSTMSLVDLSVVLSSEVGSSPHPGNAGEHNGSNGHHAAAGVAGVTPEATTTAGAPAVGAAAADAVPPFAVASDTDALPCTPHSSPQEESSAKSILSNNPHHNRHMSKRSSSTMGVLISPVSLSILATSISFSSNNGGNTTVSSAACSGVSHSMYSPNRGTAATAAAIAGAGTETGASAIETAATVPSAMNTSLSATLGSGPVRSRSNGSDSPTALLSCEAAPALFSMASGFAAWQDSSSRAVSCGTVAPFSLDHGGEDRAAAPSRSSQAAGDHHSKAALERNTNNNEVRRVDVSSPSAPSPTSSAKKPSSPTNTPFSYVDANEQHRQAASVPASTTTAPTGAAEAQAATAVATQESLPSLTSASSRCASRYSRTSSYSCGRSSDATAIPAPPPTSITTGISSGGVRKRRSGGVPGTGESVNPSPRNSLFSGYSRHGSGVSDALGDHRGAGSLHPQHYTHNGGGGNSPLASSILYVPPELRRGPEWRHLQQHIAQNIAQAHQQETFQLVVYPTVPNDSLGHRRGGGGGAQRNTECAGVGGIAPLSNGSAEERRGSYRNSSPNRRSISAIQGPSLSPTAAQQQHQQRRASSMTTTVAGRSAEEGGGAELPREIRHSVPRPHGTALQLVKPESLPGGEVPNVSCSIIPASATAQALPPPVFAYAGPLHRDGEEDDEEGLLSTCTLRGIETRRGVSVDLTGERSGCRDDARHGINLSGSSPLYIVAGTHEKGTYGLAVLEHRLSEDRRPPREASSSEEARDSLHPLADSSSSKWRSLLVHVSSPSPQRYERMVSDVPSITSESGDGETSHDGHRSSSRTFLTSASSSNAISLRSRRAGRGSRTIGTPAKTSSSDALAAANAFSFSLPLSFPSMKFASMAPGVGERPLTAVAELASLTPATASSTEVSAKVEENVAAARALSRGGSTISSGGGDAVGITCKRTSTSQLKSSSIRLRQEGSPRSAPTYRYGSRGGASETAMRKVSWARYSVASSSDKTNSCSGSGSRGDRHKLLQSPSDEKVERPLEHVGPQNATAAGHHTNPASTRYTTSDASFYTIHSNGSDAAVGDTCNTLGDKQQYQRGPSRTVQSPLQSVAAAARRRQSLQSQLEADMASGEAPVPVAATAEVNVLQQAVPATASAVHPFPIAVLGSDAMPNGEPPRRRSSELSSSIGDSLQLLSFAPLVPGLMPMADGVHATDNATRRVSSTATAMPTLCVPITTTAAATTGAVDYLHGGTANGSSLSYTGGQQRNSVVSFEEPLALGPDPFTREVTLIHQKRQHAAELKSTLELLPTAAAAAVVAAAVSAKTTTGPPCSIVVHSPHSTSPQTDGGNNISGLTDMPSPVFKQATSSPRPSNRVRSSLQHTGNNNSGGGGGGGPVYALNCSSRGTMNSKPHNPTLAAADTPFLLPNCAMMSSFDLGSPSDSTLISNTASPNANFYPAPVSNAVSVSGPLAASGGGVSSGMGDSFLTTTTDEHRMPMMLSAFPARQTPVMAPSLLTMGEGGDYVLHGNGVPGGGGEAGAVPWSDGVPLGIPAWQVASPSSRRDGGGGGGSCRRPASDAAKTALPPRPPSGGPVLSVPSTTTTTTTTTTTSSSSNSVAQSQKLLSHAGAAAQMPTTTSTSLHLGTAARWHAFSNLSSPPRSGVVMMRVGNGASSESSSSSQATSTLLPRPPSKARLTVPPATSASSAASSAAQHTTTGS
jgi:hypothetical protein